MDKRLSGYEELKHTADYSISAWAQSLEGLFIESAMGMLALMSAAPGDDSEKLQSSFFLEDEDHEDLLVNFLSEVLYLMESEETFFEKFDLRIKDSCLKADLCGRKMQQTSLEIKAVTYHNLKIENEEGEYRVTLVFDV